MHRLAVLTALFLTLAACSPALTQVAGTGALYSTRCTADMVPQGEGYETQCTPAACHTGFTDVGVSHVVVVWEPDRRILGIAERTCLQDLSRGARVFDPPRRVSKTDRSAPDPSQD